MSKKIQSNKGGEKLVDTENYVYHFASVSYNGTKRYWQCERRKTCSVRVHTLGESSEIVYRNGEHTHSATATQVAVQEARTEMKSLAQNSQGTSRNILSQVLQSMSQESRESFPNLTTQARVIRYQRNKKDPTPPNPQDRTGFDIPDEFSTLEGGAFLQWDSGKDDQKRILIFASDNGLHDLVLNKEWGADGTFSASPSIYFQLYTIHFIKDHRSFPRIFALLPSKDEDTYTRLFQALLELMPNLSPTTMMLDFEKAVVNSFQRCFPNCQIYLCLFHLSKNVYGRVMENGYKQQYHADEDFSLKIRCLPALAFLPEEDVEEGFNDLAETDIVPDEILTYFKGTYIGDMRGRGQNRRRVQPMFPIQLWNIRDRAIQGLPRTTNNLESWYEKSFPQIWHIFNYLYFRHRAINSTITCSHPNIWMLLKALKKEEILIQTKISQAEQGQGSSRMTKYMAMDKRIQTLVLNYDQDDKLKFLCSIARNLHTF